jgi:hypothetical protein
METRKTIQIASSRNVYETERKNRRDENLLFVRSGSRAETAAHGGERGDRRIPGGENADKGSKRPPIDDGTPCSNREREMPHARCIIQCCEREKPLEN